MSLPKIKSYEQIIGKSCVVEVLGMGYFRVVSETGRGDLVASQPNQQVHLGDVGWTIVVPGQFLGMVRFVEDPAITFNFAKAKKLYVHGWKPSWPWKDAPVEETDPLDVKGEDTTDFDNAFAFAEDVAAVLDYCIQNTAPDAETSVH